MRITTSLILLFFLFSCRKESFTTDPSFTLTTTEDTLHFDTVFTTTGSTTQFFKILNLNNEGIRISSIRLGGGTASPFRINADGLEGPVVQGIEIRANDSAYVFVTVSVNPTAGAMPFIVRDSILVDYNGHTKKVQLEAYGQNANFIRSRTINGTETWTSNLPYVITGGLMVAENATLQIAQGSRIFVHADAPLIVAGTLKITGDRWDSTRVVFTGDRLDEPYRGFPASWPGILFTTSSQNNHIRFAVIRNAFQAISVLGPSTTGAPKLLLEESVIDNAYDAGIIGIQSNIRARNLLVANSGKNIVLLQGGTYLFDHATITAYPNNFYQRRDPVLMVSDNAENNNADNFPLDLVFRNAIIWAESGGLVKEEVVLRKRGNLPYNAVFDHILWSLEATPARAMLTVPALLEDPRFVQIDPVKKLYDFHLKESSPALNKGVPSGVPLDLDGNGRPRGLPDLGVYEKQ